jgi:hypothetical protein
MTHNNNISMNEKNLEILHSFYLMEQTFVSKEELLKAGFDFSQFFSTSNLNHYFDIEENSFEYTDLNVVFIILKLVIKI